MDDLVAKRTLAISLEERPFRAKAAATPEKAPGAATDLLPGASSRT